MPRQYQAALTPSLRSNPCARGWPVLLALCLAAGPAAASASAPRRFALTPPGTVAGFTSYAMGLWPLPGHFSRFTGRIDVDPAHADDCSVTLDIDVASLQMDDAARARLATGPKLLDAAAYPGLAFRGSCAGGRVTGTLTLHGVTRPLELAASRRGQTVTATGTLHRQDFGIDGMPALVGRTIKLSFVVTLPADLAVLVSP